MACCNHTMFIMQDGTVKGCGENNAYQLGISNKNNQLSPIDVPICNVKQVACGSRHTMFLMQDGSVKGCGGNNQGQLGIGTKTDSQLSPVDILISNVKQISCGYEHTIFLLNDGTVKGCGYNHQRQLGIGNEDAQISPIDIPISAVKQVACGSYYTVFLMKDGSVKGCGHNGQGELGLGNTTSQLSPVDIPISNVKQISCGYEHTIFLLNDGTVKGCGKNEWGQLGIGNTTNQLSLVDIPVSNVKQVACGDSHTIFLMHDRIIKGCGYNGLGQLGIGNTDKQLSPIDIPIFNVKQIACGGSNTLFLMQNGTVKGCGNNNRGHFGLGNTTNQIFPVDIPIPNVKSLFNTLPFITKYLIVSSTNCLILSNGWQTVPISNPTNPTEQEFKEYGMDSITTITGSKWKELGDNFDILLWTENEDITEAVVKVPEYKLIDFIDDIHNIEILTWTDGQDTPKLNITGDINFLDACQSDNPEILVWTNDEDTIPSAQVQGQLNKPLYKYKVQLDDPLTPENPDNILLDWTTATEDVERNITIPTGTIQHMNPYDVKVLTKQANNKEFSDNAHIVLYNTDPFIIYAENKTNKIIGQFGDNETDKIRFKVLIDGVQIFPTSQEWSAWFQAPYNLRLTIPPEYMVPKQRYIVHIYVQDQFGLEGSHELPYTGDKYGLLFKDLEGDYYASDREDILHYLDFGTIIAGHQSDPVPVWLVNRNGVDLNNVQLHVQSDEMPSDVHVDISKTKEPFIANKDLYYTEVLPDEGQTMFYVRLSVDILAEQGGAFSLKAQGDPVEETLKQEKIKLIRK